MCKFGRWEFVPSDGFSADVLTKVSGLTKLWYTV